MLYLGGARGELSENIMDSRVVDERPNVNDTVEKRTLVAYNNPAMMAGTSESEGPNANLPTKRSTGVMQPPQTSSKKEITGAMQQSGKSTADESNGLSEGNYNSYNSLTNSVPR